MGSSHATSDTINKRLALIAGVLMVVAVTVGAQELPTGWQPSNPFPEEEAPPAVFDLEPGGTDVELYLLGSWTAQSRIATGVAFHPALPGSGNRMTLPYRYPGFETELFAQTVDLTLSLWLYRNYFFEASFSDQSDVNTIAAGYFGNEGELVQEVVAGNVPLTVEQYPYQYTGSPGARTGRDPMPGAVMRLETARTYHELLVQIESSQARRLRLSSGGILTEERIPAHRYLRDARYVLPDRNISSFAVYVADPNGTVLSRDGTERFRELDATAGEYTVDTSAGTLRLSQEIAESGLPVAVYYRTADGVAVGQSGAGEGALIPLDSDTLQPTTGALVDFEFSGDALLDRLTGSSAGGGGDDAGPRLDDYELPLADGRSALLLRQSGLWSPFESANVYSLPTDLPVPEEDGLQIRLVNPGTRTPIADEGAFRTRRLGSAGLLEIVATNSGARDMTWRYPFANRAPREAHAGIYGPRARSGGAPLEILVTYRSDQEALSLDGDVVPGTVAVTVDGRPLRGVEFDPASGRLTLPDSVSSTAVVDVSYREYTSGGAGDLVAISGNRWEATPNLSLALAAGVRWTLTDESYSTELDQHPGRATLSTAATYRGESLTVDATAALQLSQSDTTGVMRLAGATGRSTSITPDAETTFPASPPGPTGDQFGPENRAETAYRDYWSVDAVGNVSLLPYGRSPAADTPRSGSRVGPYLAASTDAAYSGPVAVLEWDELAPQQWVGAQIRLAGGETDLTSARSVTVRYRVLPPVGADKADIPDGGTPQLRLDLGALQEDLDGDTVLDEGRSPVDPLLEFSAPQGLRRAGQDAPRLAAAHSEDGNTNGILDGEAPGGVFSSEVLPSGASTPLAGTSWHTVTIPVTGTDRSRLTATRAARLILNNEATTGTLSGGRLLIGTVEVARTTEAVIISQGGGTADVAAVDDPLAGTAEELRRRFSVVGGRLAPESDSQRVFVLDWPILVGGDPVTGTVAFETGITDFSRERYGTLSFFLFLDVDASSVTGDLDSSGAPQESVEVSLAPYGNAPEDTRITITLPAAELTDRWHRVDVSLASGEVRIDGDPTDFPAALPENGDYLRTVQVATRGLASGKLYVDELHATDPTAGLSAAGEVDAVWQRTISDGWFTGTRMTVEQRITAQGEEFSAAAAATSAADRPGTPVGRSLRSTTLLRGEREHFLTEVQTTVETNGDQRSGAFGHRLHAPLLPAGAIRMSERFYRNYAPRNTVADREIELTSSGNWGTWRLSTANRADQREILQQWGGSATAPVLGSVATSVTADVSVRSLDQAIEAEPYGASWLASTARVLPRAQDDGRQERTGDTTVTAGFGGFEFNPAAGWVNRASISSDQTDRLEFTARWPVAVRAEGSRPWEIEPQYRRSWTLQRTSTAATLSDDVEHWGRSVGRDTPAVAAIPVVELFQPTSGIGYDTLGPDEVTRTHDAEARVRFGRALGSRPRDLYVPSEITAGVTRNRRWESDSREDQRVWELGITATAINLYGAQGSRPRFTWYQSDEYENRISLRLNEPVGGTPNWGITVGQTTRLFGFDATEGELTSSLEIDGPDPQSVSADSGAVVRWRTLRYPNLSFFERLQEEPYYQHEEKLSVVADFEDGTYRGSEVIIQHRTTLIIGANGTISAYGDLGWLADPARYEAGTLHAIGLQVGLEGRLEY